MNEIFVNLKRFDIPKKYGGICPQEDPREWIEGVMEDTVASGLGKMEVNLTYLLPEGLVLPAIAGLGKHPSGETENINIGVQGVFREDTSPDNFGAFTTNLPAAAAKNLGCTWSIIGHSEERKDKFEVFRRFEPGVATDETLMKRANDRVSELLNEENNAALKRGLNVLFCVGETAEERGDGTFEQQKPGIEAVLRGQLAVGLEGVSEHLPGNRVVIGYEPRWAIGPGKTPPGAEYIGFVSAYIKSAVMDLYGLNVPVVYGGGLKEENARMIGNIETIDGGLVALTRFTGDIAFEPEGLKSIIEIYLA